MQNKIFLYRVIGANALILFIVFGTFFSVFNFLEHKLKNILEQRQSISMFYNSVNQVASHLYQASMLDDAHYLTSAALTSNRALAILERLHEDGFNTRLLEENYDNFFRFTVSTTAFGLEHRLEESRGANEMGQQKKQELLTQLKEIEIKIDDKKDSIIALIETFMAISSFLLVIVVVVNIKLISNSFLVIRTKESEQAEMINALGDGVYGVDKLGNCTFINHSALVMLGFSEHEVLNKNQHLMFHHHYPDGREYPVEKCPIHLTTHDRTMRHVQETFIRKDGSQLPVSVTVAPLGKDKGVVVFQDMTTIKEEHDTLDRSANYDYLTQLPNRRLFMILAEQKIAESKRRKNLIAIAFLDLDGFKLVNDFHGHDIGDNVLEEVAKRFKATLRESDIIARFGGDEFVVLLDSPQSIDEVEETLKRIIQEISHPFHINNLSLQVGVSIGYTLFLEDESDINSLLKHADDAMYDAKQAGKGILKRFQG